MLLRNPAGTLACCHYGGDIDFLPDGTLTLTVGDDTSPRVEGFNPRDNRPGFEEYNAERTAQNPQGPPRQGPAPACPTAACPTAARRASAPNPFVKNQKYDPYVYAMGFRSNYRSANDPRHRLGVRRQRRARRRRRTTPTAARAATTSSRPSRAGGGTNHGWPRCIGNNIPYRRLRLRHADVRARPLSCKGMTPATMWYPYGKSDRFPQARRRRRAHRHRRRRLPLRGQGPVPPARTATRATCCSWSGRATRSGRCPSSTSRRDDGSAVRGYGKVRPTAMRLVAQGLLPPDRRRHRP